MSQIDVTISVTVREGILGDGASETVQISDTYSHIGDNPRFYAKEARAKLAETVAKVSDRLGAVHAPAGNVTRLEKTP